jgi:hypothetical protein
VTALLYDSTNPQAIPVTVGMFARYVDGLYKTIWDIYIARFPPSTPYRRIACVTVNTPSDTADFERYDLNPPDVVPWHRNMTALGEKNLWAYASRSERVAVEDQAWAAGIPLDALSMWIATLDGTQIVAQYRYPVAAVQYTDTGSVDLSVVYQDTIGGDDMTPEEHEWLSYVPRLFNLLTHNVDTVAFPGTPGTGLAVVFTNPDNTVKVPASGGGTEPPEPAEPKTVTLHIPPIDIPGTLG